MYILYIYVLTSLYWGVAGPIKAVIGGERGREIDDKKKEKEVLLGDWRQTDWYLRERERERGRERQFM